MWTHVMTEEEQAAALRLISEAYGDTSHARNYLNLGYTVDVSNFNPSMTLEDEVEGGPNGGFYMDGFYWRKPVQ